MTKVSFLTASLMLMLGTTTQVFAEYPATMNVQGRLSDSTGAPVAAVARDFTFKIFDSEPPGSGTQIWPAGPGEIQSITTDAGGLWSAQVGSVIPLSHSAFEDSLRWLEVTITEGLNPPEVMPRIRLTTGPFAYRVATVDGAEGGNVSNTLTVGANHGPVGSQCFVAGTQNTVNSYQSSICGGRFNQVDADQSFIGGGYMNLVSSDYGVVGGGRNNTVGGDVAAIAGGEHNSAVGVSSIIGGGSANYTGGLFSGVMGGIANQALGNFSGVVVGLEDTAMATFGTVLSGWGNLAGMSPTDTGAVVGGGRSNKATGSYSFIGSGVDNRVFGDNSAIVGGVGNLVEGHHSAILGGLADTITSTANHSYLFGIGSKLTADSTFMVAMPHVRFGDEATGYEIPSTDGANGSLMVTDGSGVVSWTDPSSLFATRWTLSGSVLATDGNWGIVRGGAGNLYYGANVASMVSLGSNGRTGANGFDASHCTIGGGYENVAQSTGSVVSGGIGDSAFAYASAILGGFGNQVNGAYAVIGGGIANQAVALESGILGGRSNYVVGANSMIGGGQADTVRAKYSGIASGFKNGIGTDTDSASFIGSGTGNSITSSLCFIGSGRNNSVTAEMAFLGGGNTNSVWGTSAVVCGGGVNVASGGNSGVVSGWDNATSATRSFIGGGAWNRADQQYGAIAGGAHNKTSGFYSFIGGGEHNHATGDYSAIPGGRYDTLGAGANIAMAFGNSVYLNTSHRVAFFDGSASGRLGINRDDHEGGINHPIHVGTSTSNGNGAHLTNGGTWTNGSSREFKDSFQQLNGESVLDKIAGMRIEAWQYKGGKERHIGPVAEDFVAAFDVGTTRLDGTRENQYLSHGDLAGVALVAIQELDQRTKRVVELESELSELRSLVQELLSAKQ